MARWKGGDEAEAGDSVGRLQVFKLGKHGAFELVHEVDRITRRGAGRVRRPLDSVAAWRSAAGGDAVLFSRDPAVLAHFKAWRVELS